jgi:hypothetical protein
MKKYNIISVIIILIVAFSNSAEAINPAKTTVSKRCEVQAGGYDLDQYSSAFQEYDQATSCNISVSGTWQYSFVNASAEGYAHADFGPGIPQIGTATAGAEIDTYNGKSEANFVANVVYYFEIQPIKVVPDTPPTFIPVLFSARGEGYSHRVGYGLSTSYGVVHLTGDGLDFDDARFEFEAYVVDETAYDSVDEEYQEDGFEDTRHLNLPRNHTYYTVNVHASCKTWAGPVGQEASATVDCFAEVGPSSIIFDQSTFDAMMGTETFVLEEYYKFVFSENLPLQPKRPKFMPWIALLLLNE